MRVLLLLSILWLPTAVYASGNEVKVPFLFTDDQAVPQTDLANDIAPSDALRTDAYLSAPMTRLEYMLTRMEAALNNENTIAVITSNLRKRFDRARPQVSEESVHGFAGYSERLGRVLAGYRIEGMGRPRSPMREACIDVLTRIGYKLPFAHSGYTLHNTLLGVLGQREYPAYTAILGKLAAQFVHRVYISSETDEGKVHHTLGCQRTAENSPITYDKFSFRLK